MSPTDSNDFHTDTVAFCWKEVDMYAEERRAHLTVQLRREGRLDVARAADDLNVTGETVRRDLIELERQGVLRRTHGGAIPVETLGFEPETTVRAAAMVEQKRRIAQAAVAELPAEGAIILDTGTTTALLAEFLPTDRKLTVVTNSLQALNMLVAKRNITVMAIGGRLRPESLSTVDLWAQRELADVHVDLAFIGTNGLTVERGLTTSDQSEAAIKGQMITCARRVVLLADHSKVGTEYFHRVAGLSQIDLLITDTELDEDLATDLRATGLTVIAA